MWMNKSISVSMPAYNEQDGIAAAVQGFRDIRDVAGNPVVDEIIVIDNNSSDATAERALASGATVVSESRQGYGFAVRRGLAEATKDIVVICEPDGTFVPKDIFKLLSYSEEFDMVCGTRTTRELFWEEANMGIFLRVGNLVVAKLLELLYGTCSLSDCGCTFRLIHREALQKIQHEFHVGTSHFLPNMVIAARLHDLTLIEIPLTYRDRIGESKITGTLAGKWKTGLAMISLILMSWPDYIARKLRK